MMKLASSLYVGDVVHKRLRPRQHELVYRVFSMLVDLDELDRLPRELKLFSRNRWNIFSLHDRDHGAGDGMTITDSAHRCLEAVGRPHQGRRILLLTYPRVFGYVFNPLSVYYVYDREGRLETVIYEVSNTFGERESYVVPAGAKQNGDVYAQHSAKGMFVSPFTEGKGDYAFRVTEPEQQAVVAVLLRDTEGPVLKTHFRAERMTLSDMNLLRLALRIPFMTTKIIIAIHYEALKLWLKGVPLTTRHKSPRYAVSAPPTTFSELDEI